MYCKGENSYIRNDSNVSLSITHFNFYFYLNLFFNLVIIKIMFIFVKELNLNPALHQRPNGEIKKTDEKKRRDKG